MPNYPLPDNESQRIETLASLGVLDSPNNACLDRITRIACDILNVPIAMINFITSDEDVTKASCGIEPGRRTDRQVSFCSYIILSDEPMIIADAASHEKFKDYPNVKDGIRIRAFAGVPLKAVDTTNPGALCIVDTEPRTFSKTEITLLKDLAHWAELEINSPKPCLLTN